MKTNHLRGGSPVLMVLLVVVPFFVTCQAGRLIGTFPHAGLSATSANPINPLNAAVGDQMFMNSNFAQLFPFTPAWDAANQRFFFPALNDPTGEMKIAERWNEVNQQEADELKRMKKEAPTGWAKVRSDLAKVQKLKRALITDSNSLGVSDPPNFQCSIWCLQVTPDGKNITLVSSWPFPFPYFFSLEYDPVTDKVFVLAMNETDSADANDPFPMLFSSVDVKTGAVRVLTQLPSPLIPATTGAGGSPTAIDVKQRQFVASTWHVVAGQILQDYVTFINLDTLAIMNVPQNKYIPASMYFDTTKNLIYALLSPTASGALGNLTWGTVDSKSGAITPIYTWQDDYHVFVIGSFAALDSAAGRFYSIIGSGTGTAVDLVTVDVVTGQQLNVAPWNRELNQPQSILVIP